MFRVDPWGNGLFARVHLAMNHLINKMSCLKLKVLLVLPIRPLKSYLIPFHLGFLSTWLRGTKTFREALSSEGASRGSPWLGGNCPWRNLWANPTFSQVNLAKCSIAGLFCARHGPVAAFEHRCDKASLRSDPCVSLCPPGSLFNPTGAQFPICSRTVTMVPMSQGRSMSARHVALGMSELSSARSCSWSDKSVASRRHTLDVSPKNPGPGGCPPVPGMSHSVPQSSDLSAEASERQSFPGTGCCVLPKLPFPAGTAADALPRMGTLPRAE